YTDKDAPEDDMSFYWVVPYRKEGSGRAEGEIGDYVYGKAAAGGKQEDAAVSEIQGQNAETSDKAFLRTLSKTDRSGRLLMSRESYQEVCLTPVFNVNRFFYHSPSADPLFVCFPAPDGALPAGFSSCEAYYFNESDNIEYYYNLREKYTREEFIPKSIGESYILKDGVDGMTVYIHPDRMKASGMLEMKEFGTDCRLIITVYIYGADKKTSDDVRINTLSETILQEIERVRTHMHDETLSPYWSLGRYEGVKYTEYTGAENILKLTFPRMPFSYGTKTLEADFCVSKMISDTDRGYSRLEGIFDFGDGYFAEFIAAVEMSPYVISRLEDKDPDTYELPLKNGSWYVTMKFGSHCYAAKKLGYRDSAGHDLYLSLEFEGNKISFNTLEMLIPYLQLIDDNYEETTVKADPYVVPENLAAENTGADTDGPTGTEESEAQDAGRKKTITAPGYNAGTWICENCGSENTSAFCPDCGTPRPVSMEWTCENCGSVNESNFCPECGAARPAR
ncbi:MAG: hypothetical protein IKN57_13985, partial [Parasporobacterium sp.]|nr:hypothetical protein [Parasporobacterium sp.]